MSLYVVFSGYECAPYGGWTDLTSIHETLSAAATAAANHPDPIDWQHIVDIKTATIIYDWRRWPGGGKEMKRHAFHEILTAIDKGTPK